MLIKPNTNTYLMISEYTIDLLGHQLSDYSDHDSDVKFRV